jgi:hypothetical protein
MSGEQVRVDAGAARSFCQTVFERAGETRISATVFR